MKMVAGLLAGLLMAGSATAAGANDFYQGKTVTIIVGLAPGGGYDVHARAFARYFGRHIPGQPNVVVSNKPGAATATATGYVYYAAPKDGTVIGMSLDILPLYQTLFPERVQFDMTKVKFIGNMATLNSVIAISDKSPVQTVADLKGKEVIVGSNGILSQTYIIPALLNELNGTKFKIVLGFQGTAQMDLAIERGELHGRGGQWSSFVVRKADWIKAGKIKPLMQIGMEEDPDMKGVPLLLSMAENDQQRAIYRIISQLPRLSRALWVSPDVPADRVEILRKAFAQTVKDKDLLAEAAKTRLEITPTFVAEVEAAVREVAATPKTHLDVIRRIVSVKSPAGKKK